MIACDVEPSDHKYELAAEDVKVTEPPKQNVIGPTGVMVGVAGFGFTVIVVGAEVALQPLEVTVTVYDPEVETVIDCVVSPEDHK
ncbi:hypothetical protein D3C80_1105340 [compost metagenome]